MACTWWNLHPELLALPMVIAAVLLAAQQRTSLATLMLLAVLLVKEDAALVVGPLAIWLGATGMWAWRRAVVVAGVAAAYFVAVRGRADPGVQPDR